MTTPVRFALIGKSGSGKSRAAAILSDILGVRHIKTGAICRQIARLLFDNENKQSTQRLDDALTGIDPSIFLRAALRSTSPEEGFVLDALRFRSDLQLARDCGCLLIRLVAPEAMRVARLQARGQAFDPIVDGAHRSEVELDDVKVDFAIVNDGEFDLVQRELSEIASRF